MRDTFVKTGETAALVEYLKVVPSKAIARELTIFRKVLRAGTPEEQTDAVDAIAYSDHPRVRRALINLLENTTAPLEVRDRAAEMLHLQSGRATAEACVRALKDPTPSIRFWAAYSLGQIAYWRGELRQAAAAALQHVLDDKAIAPGWWSVGREAQAIIVGLRDIAGERERLQETIRIIQNDPNASTEEKKWAEHYAAGG